MEQYAIHTEALTKFYGFTRGIDRLDLAVENAFKSSLGEST